MTELRRVCLGLRCATDEAEARYGWHTQSAELDLLGPVKLPDRYVYALKSNDRSKRDASNNGLA